MYQAELIDNATVKTVVKAISFCQLRRKIEFYVRTRKIILYEGEQLFFPRGQENITNIPGVGMEFTFHYLVMRWGKLCAPKCSKTRWKISEVIK